MRFRSLLLLTALISSILGGVAVYLALTVPNDVQAGALMKQAREQMLQGDDDRARQSLGHVMQQYPRTDAAAAAAVALSTLEARQREKLAHDVASLRKSVSAQTLQLGALTTRLSQPAPAPAVAAAPAPAAVIAPPATAPAKAPAKKPEPKKRTHRSRHRRRR